MLVKNCARDYMQIHFCGLLFPVDHLTCTHVTEFWSVYFHQIYCSDFFIQFFIYLSTFYQGWWLLSFYVRVHIVLGHRWWFLPGQEVQTPPIFRTLVSHHIGELQDQVFPGWKISNLDFFIVRLHVSSTIRYVFWESKYTKCIDRWGSARTQLESLQCSLRPPSRC